jgi:fructose 1,6-bisphosphatase
MSWRLSVISETFPGSDGHVGVVTVKTSSGQFKRPIYKLVLMPCNNAGILNFSDMIYHGGNMFKLSVL